MRERAVIITDHDDNFAVEDRGDKVVLLRQGPDGDWHEYPLKPIEAWTLGRRLQEAGIR